MPDITENLVLRAILERRSVRAYAARPLAPEEIRAILTAGIYAPSGKNLQAMRFMLLPAGDARREVLTRGLKVSRHAVEAPLLVLLLLDRSRSYHPVKDHQGMGAVAQNMLLAAHALGLGGVWIGENVDSGPKTLAELGLDPERYALEALLAFGQPARAPEAPKRKPLEEYIVG